jgi:nucleotide-binding universal stress UspA family protein
VLVLHEHAGILTNMHPEGTRAVRILVALDGSALAEAVLEPAAYLSAALSAPQPGALHLTEVLHMPTRYEYGQNDSLAKAKQQRMVNAEAYLHTIEQRLREGELGRLNLQVTSSVADDLNIAPTLIGMAENGEHMDEVAGFYGCDMVAMATHGRSGLQRWMLGSVTERVLEATRLPLLIMQPQKNDSKAEKTRKAPETAGELPSFVGLL